MTEHTHTKTRHINCGRGDCIRQDRCTQEVCHARELTRPEPPGNTHAPISREPVGTVVGNRIGDKVERVDHPAHYGGDVVYETIKVLEAWLTPEEYRGFLKGQVIKYQSRLGHHVAGEPASQDAAKAAWYAQRLSDFLKKIEAPKHDHSIPKEGA